jgi:hypothetical protein
MGASFDKLETIQNVQDGRSLAIETAPTFIINQPDPINAKDLDR